MEQKMSFVKPVKAYIFLDELAFAAGRFPTSAIRAFTLDHRNLTTAMKVTGRKTEKEN